MNHVRRLFAWGALGILFCFFSSAAGAAEIQLLGIKLGSNEMSILNRYGNPADIQVGGAPAATSAATAAPTGTGPTGPGMRGAGSAGRMDMMGRPGMQGRPGMMNAPATLGPAGMGPMGRMRGASPMAPGATGPGSQSPQMAAPAAPTGGASVVYIYRFSNDRTAEFSINQDGAVTQIIIRGAAWAGQRTAKGITLGSSYKDVLKKYGFPENHEQQGLQLLLNYGHRDRIVFTLVGRTVVAMTIALQ